MSKNKKVRTISYSTELIRIWDMLIRLDEAPMIYPPSIKVTWEGKVNEQEVLDTDGRRIGIVCARMNTRWAYIEPDNINPVDYHMAIYHYAYEQFLGKGYQFNGKLSGRLQRMYVWHNIIHEACHYLNAYEQWLKLADDDDISKMLEYLKMMGSEKDEKITEYRTLKILAKMFGYNIELLPRFDGPFMKNRSKNDRLYLALIQYFYYEYKKSFLKLTEDENNELTDREWKIIDFLLTDYNKDEVVEYCD